MNGSTAGTPVGAIAPLRMIVEDRTRDLLPQVIREEVAKALGGLEL
jgi:hypothetical protein